MYGITIVPSAIMAAGFLLQETALYWALQRHGAAPGPAVWGLFFLANMLIPHIGILYMKRQLSSASAAEAGQGFKAAGGQLQSSGDDQPPPDAPISKSAALEAKQKEAEQDLAAIRGAQQQQRQQQGSDQGKVSQVSIGIDRSDVLSCMT
jgi:hypothetical protein